MKIRVIANTLIACCLGWTSLSAQSDPSVAKEKLAKWVETRQMISKEVTDWEADKELLIATRDLLSNQVKALDEQVKELKSEETASDQSRKELLDKKDQLQIADIALAQQVATLEKQILELVKIFPEPLKAKLEPLIVQIPENPEESDATLGKRMGQVLAILNQAEKFNSTATFVGETREVGGQKIQVKTVYWGMSFAIYVDSQGKTAGFGKPTSDGWVWTENKELAADAKRFIDMYEGNTDVIEFVALPISVQ
ncbi:DUF3450 family protein [Cerasicoccus fimbriatus]|uniref:DUF3450 family protein n=1 Tax=Cerasicoccus fimbriatus TaxID=3014554 RepID=UPI0022B2DE15|nr:DUF3450 family protein [Cerasicoccus sp. TK19100]